MCASSDWGKLGEKLSSKKGLELLIFVKYSLFLLVLKDLWFFEPGVLINWVLPLSEKAL